MQNNCKVEIITINLLSPISGIKYDYFVTYLSDFYMWIHIHLLFKGYFIQ